MGHPRRDTQPLGQGPNGVREPGRVQAAGVGHDAHPAVVRQSQALLQLGEKCLGVTAVGVLHPVATQDQHGQLGQVVPGQIVQFAAGEHLAHR